MKTISAEQLHTLQREGQNITLIDVRSPAEFRSVHVQSAVNLPLGDLDAKTIAQHANPEDDIYLICHSGGCSTQACEQLKGLGFTNVISIDGGTAACLDCGVPVNEGKKIMSIERQVRIVAGLLVVLGVILSITLTLHSSIFPHSSALDSRSQVSLTPA